MDDETDWQNLKRGEVAALERCYRRHGPAVQRLCRRIVGEASADDLAQEVFLKVWRAAAKFDGRSSLATWIHQITVNHCLRHLERERRQRTLPLAFARDRNDARRDLQGVDDRDHVESLLARLEPEQRALIVLREWEGMDYRRIAEILNLPLGTVMSRLHRARQRLIEDAQPPRAATQRWRLSTT